jgi:hypothetical protein
MRALLANSSQYMAAAGEYSSASGRCSARRDAGFAAAGWHDAGAAGRLDGLEVTENPVPQ